MVTSSNPGSSEQFQLSHFFPIFQAALSAIHKIICQVMANKCVAIKDNVSVMDFAKIVQEKSKPKNTERVGKQQFLIML